MNNTTAALVEDPDWTPINAGLLALQALCSLWTVGANTVILSCFVRMRRKPWTSFGRLTLGMSASDLLVGFTSIPFFIRELTLGRLYGFVISASIFLCFSVETVSLFHVLGICLLRNVKLKSKSSQGNTGQEKRYITIIMVTSWTLPFILFSIPFSIWSSFRVEIIPFRADSVFGANLGRFMTCVFSFYFISQCSTIFLYSVSVIRLLLSTRRRIKTVAPIENQEKWPNKPTNTSSDTRIGEDLNDSPNQPVVYVTGMEQDKKKAIKQTITSPNTSEIARDREMTFIHPNAITTLSFGEIEKGDETVQNQGTLLNVTTMKEVHDNKQNTQTDTGINRGLESEPSRSNTVIETTGMTQCNDNGSRRSNTTTDVTGMNLGQATPPVVKYQKQAAVTIGILLALFILFTLPLSVALFFSGNNSKVDPQLIYIMNTFFIMDSGFNPIIYATRIPMIKESVKKLVVDVLKFLRLRQ